MQDPGSEWNELGAMILQAADPAQYGLLGWGVERARKEAIVLEVVLKTFENPDEVRTFDKGKFELVHIGGMTIGRATYEPGWKWSEHVGGLLGKKSCDVEHVGMVISGRATAAMDDGRIIEMRAGDIFYIAPGHDSWVVGQEPYISLHLMGATDYASHKATTVK
jgi:mannose-6-phosphate isomerase-like protein (cupin superfamily)